MCFLYILSLPPNCVMHALFTRQSSFWCFSERETRPALGVKVCPLESFARSSASSATRPATVRTVKTKCVKVWNQDNKQVWAWRRVMTGQWEANAAEGVSAVGINGGLAGFGESHLFLKVTTNYRYGTKIWEPVVFVSIYHELLNYKFCLIAEVMTWYPARASVLL